MQKDVEGWEIVFFPGMFIITLMLAFDWMNYVFTQDVDACLKSFCGYRLPMIVGVGFLVFGLWVREFYRGERKS